VDSGRTLFSRINEKSALEWSQSNDADQSLHRPEDGGFLFLQTDAVSQDDVHPPSMKKRKEEWPSSRTFQPGL